MQGTFFVVGVGPGDPQLLTIKAARVLERCNVWFVPSAFENGGSMALKIVSGAVASEGKTILSHRFPMKRVPKGESVDPEVRLAWENAAATITKLLNEGQDVVFPTLGDPAIYSTGFYVCETLLNSGCRFAIEIVPGVSAIGATSAEAGVPLCLGDEQFVVVPATFDNEQLRQFIELSDSIAFMKVHRVMARLVDLLEEFSLVEKAVLVERCSLPDQRVWTDIRQVVGKKIHYFSTMIVRK